MRGILTDLDGTLLKIDMNGFIPKYLEKMNAFGVKTGFVPRENHLTSMVLKGTDAIFQNQDRTKTNQEVFWEFLFQDPYFADQKEKTFSFFEAFYEEIFPELKRYTAPFPFSQGLMETMFETGLEVVVATSPVFPLKAIQMRLSWAGIAEYPYSLITSYEVMHTSKPNTDYYREIMNHIGFIPSECLMIGNDTRDDLPAGRIGITTYLLEEMLLDRGEGLIPDYRGKAEDLIKFLKNLKSFEGSNFPGTQENERKKGNDSF